MNTDIKETKQVKDILSEIQQACISENRSKVISAGCRKIGISRGVPEKPKRRK